MDGSLNTITSNDRRYTCTSNNCSLLQPDYGVKDLFSINFVVLNTQVLIEQLSMLKENARQAVNGYMTWLDNLEAEVELKRNLNEIKPTMTLFNRLDVLIPKVLRGRKNLNAWHTNFLNVSSQLQDYIRQYTNVSSQITELAQQAQLQTSLPVNMVRVAKRNLSKSKSIERQTTKVLSLETQIRNTSRTLLFSLNDLAAGIINLPGASPFNVNTLAAAFAELNTDNTPLQRIQNNLADIINSTPINYSLNTRPIEQLNDPTTISGLLARLNNESFDGDKIMKALAHFKDSYLYTDHTREALDAIFKYITINGSNSPQYAAMVALIEDTKKNLPSTVIEELRTRSTSNENIYVTIKRITDILDNLDPSDVVYRDALVKIHGEAVQRAKTLITSELNIENIIPPSNNTIGLPTPASSNNNENIYDIEMSNASSQPFSGVNAM